MDDLGFNGSGSLFVSSRFKAGEPLTAKKLNEIVSSVQTALPMPYLGEGNQISYTGGGSLILNNKNPDTLKLKPFDVIVNKVNDEYHLKVVSGETGYNYAVTDAGATYTGSLYPLFYTLTKFNLYPTGSITTGSDTNSKFVSQNGYIKLTSGNNYVVFIYMLSPEYEPENSNEFHVPHLAISKIGDLPEQTITNATGSNSSADIVIAKDTGYSQYISTFSLRANIARIKWNSTTSSFSVQQITNSPTMYFSPNVFGRPTYTTSLITTYTNNIIAGFSGYTFTGNDDTIGYTAPAQGEMI